MGESSNLTELTTPAAGDLLLVRDISEAADKDKRITLANLAAAGLTVVAPTVKAASAAGLSLQDDGGNVAAQVLDGGKFQLSNLYFNQYQTMADDTAFSFSPGANWGMMFIFAPTVTALAAIVAWRATVTSNSCVIMAQNGTNAVATTGVLAGTTGTDGKFTITTHTDQKIYLENRLGAAHSVRYFIITAE